MPVITSKSWRIQYIYIKDPAQFCRPGVNINIRDMQHKSCIIMFSVKLEVAFPTLNPIAQESSTIMRPVTMGLNKASSFAATRIA